MTSISSTSPVERVARVIAAEMLSPNAEGAGDLGRPVSEIVDMIWTRETHRALAVLRTLREPTPAMIEAGRLAGDDPADIWSAMMNAAIREAPVEVA
ncbi:hypothetical protein ACX40Y_07995 [Sphingomonas sp. RS6]